MSWDEQFADNIRTVEQLEEYLKLSPAAGRKLRKVVERHPMSVTPYYASLIDWEDENDPLRRMMIPSEAELDLAGAYDQSGEQSNTKLQGLQHKYTKTVLLLTTNKCTAYCRYCFRKRLVGVPSSEIMSRFSDAAAYLRKHKEVNNVLLSGGDPLYLSTKMVGKLIETLASIDHLDFIRIGTKVPIAMPSRINGDDELLKILKDTVDSKKQVFVSTQFNHPNEITPESTKAVRRLLRAGVITNNQTVLLKGVNDDPETLARLQSRLSSIGVIPYYVFQCRPVKRVKKMFQVPLADGYRIVEKARSLLDGYSKRFRYVMSHKEGKISVAGMDREYFYFRYHQARIAEKTGRFFKRRYDPEACWLDDLRKP